MKRFSSRFLLPTALLSGMLLLLWLGVACGAGAKKAPAIPHPTTSTEDGYCLGCHQSGAGGAMVTTHPSRTGCTACHKPQS